MPISYLTRIVEFSATHYIRRADWPEERNAREFGRAATLDRLLAEQITRRLDGRSINEALPEFGPGRRLATGEALTVYLWEHIAPQLPRGVTLHAVRVQEGPHIYSEYFGEKG